MIQGFRETNGKNLETQVDIKNFFQNQNTHLVEALAHKKAKKKQNRKDVLIFVLYQFFNQIQFNMIPKLKKNH